MGSGRESGAWLAARKTRKTSIRHQHSLLSEKGVERKTYLEENSGKGGGEPLCVICGIEHRKPHPKASLSEVAQRGNHKKALKLCHSEILTHLAVGAVCATCKRSPKKQNFYSAFPTSFPCSQRLHHSQGSRGQFNKLGKLFWSVSHL